mmetsp:Transcript_20333/g.60698  ORF Transcript_20333/g.60698 Transcript_20333/m.60698 type:complete len:236 (-) Transcript_20333:397-1104(-)
MITRNHLDNAIDANIAVREAVRRSVAALRGLGLFACAERRIRLTVAKRAGPAITVVIWRLSIANDVGVEVVVEEVVVTVRVAFKLVRVRVTPVKVAPSPAPWERVRAVRRENLDSLAVVAPVAVEVGRARRRRQIGKAHLHECSHGLARFDAEPRTIWEHGYNFEALFARQAVVDVVDLVRVIFEAAGRARADEEPFLCAEHVGEAAAHAVEGRFEVGRDVEADPGVVAPCGFRR